MQIFFMEFSVLVHFDGMCSSVTFLITDSSDCTGCSGLDMGQDSSVVIVTRYGLDGPGIESRWEAIFSAHVQTGPGAHPASYTMGTGSLPGVKRSGRGVEHQPPYSTEVKERVEPYLFSTSGPSLPATG